MDQQGSQLETYVPEPSPTAKSSARKLSNRTRHHRPDTRDIKTTKTCPGVSRGGATGAMPWGRCIGHKAAQCAQLFSASTAWSDLRYGSTAAPARPATLDRLRTPAHKPEAQHTTARLASIDSGRNRSKSVFQSTLSNQAWRVAEDMHVDGCPPWSYDPQHTHTMVYQGIQAGMHKTQTMGQRGESTTSRMYSLLVSTSSK